MESNKKKKQKDVKWERGQTQISGYGWTCTILLKFGEVKWEKKETFAYILYTYICMCHSVDRVKYFLINIWYPGKLL